MTVAKDFEEFFASRNKHRVEYLVVGGYAFAVYAHPRYTGDMDVFVRATEENARRIIAALNDLKEDLIANKRASGRKQDLLDLEDLV